MNDCWQTTARFLLALTMWREARGEPDPGMLAVGCVVRNRVARNHQATWIGTMTAPHQFTSISVIGDSQTVRWPSLPSPAWERAWGLSGAIMGVSGGPVDDPTGGATFYRNPATATSGWFDHQVATGKLQETVTIGNHVFYTEA